MTEISFNKTIKWYYTSGNVNENVDFEYGELTTARYGCGFVFKGEYWYFGGYDWNRRQVSITQLISLYII